MPAAAPSLGAARDCPDSTFLQNTFQAQYPKLMQLWASMMTRLHTVASGSAGAGLFGGADPAHSQRIEYAM